MKLTEENRVRLGVALNEADLLGVELDEAQQVAAVTVAVLTLPESGPAPEDSRVQILLHRVGRLAASFREGPWHDIQAPATPFETDKILDIVRSFGGQPIYGWEFFDVHAETFTKWKDRRSLDWRHADGSTEHSLSLFQEGAKTELDLCIWFDEFELRTPSGNLVDADTFCEDGQRWWNAMHAGDPATDGKGIGPIRSD